jgi:integrase
MHHQGIGVLEVEGVLIGGDVTLGADAGVVDKDVEPAVSRSDGFDRSADRRVVLTATEVAKLVAAVRDDTPRYAALKTNGRYRALVLMGCWLGPRWNEAIGLRVCDVNPLQGEVTFGRVVVNQNGGRTFVEKGSKTGDWRTVPVPAPVMNELADHIAGFCTSGERDAFLFLTGAGTHPMRQNFPRFVLHKALARAGLAGRGISWVSLRHTAASLMFI